MTSVLFNKVRPPVIGQEKMSTTEQGVVEKPPLPPKPSLEMVPENELSPKSPKLSENKPNVETSPPTGTGSETSRSFQPEGTLSFRLSTFQHFLFSLFTIFFRLFQLFRNFTFKHFLCFGHFPFF